MLECQYVLLIVTQERRKSARCQLPCSFLTDMCQANVVPSFTVAQVGLQIFCFDQLSFLQLTLVHLRYPNQHSLLR